MKTKPKEETAGPILSSKLLTDFVAAQNSRTKKPSPNEELVAVIKRIEVVAYTIGLQEAVSRMEMVASIVPSSVTKAQLVDMIKMEIDDCISKWKSFTES